jgi:tetratricopeptide (TPR) repeat protein
VNTPVPDNLINKLLADVRQEDIPAAKAIRYVDQVLSTFRKIGLSNQDPLHTLVVLINIGESYDALSSLEKATEVYLEALELARSQNNTEREAYTLWKLGGVYRKRNRWVEALSYLAESKKHQAEGSEGLAWCWMNEGLIKSSQGFYTEAIEAFTYGLEIGERLHHDRIVAAATMNMGIIDIIQGNFEKATLLFYNCIGSYDQLDKPKQKAFALHNLGLCFTAVANYASALDAFEKSITIAQDISDLILTSLNYVHKAAVYLALNDLTLVATYCARALDTFNEVDYPLGIAETYKVLGQLYTKKQDWATAQGLLNESLRLCQQYEKPLGIAEVNREIGKLYIAQNKTEMARETLQTAHEQFLQLNAQHDATVTKKLLEAF